MRSATFSAALSAVLGLLLSACGPVSVSLPDPAAGMIVIPGPIGPALTGYEVVVSTVAGAKSVYGVAPGLNGLIVSNHYALESLNDGRRTPFAGDPAYLPPVDLTGVRDCAGFADGSGLAAKFCHPDLLRADAAGTLYVADNYNFRLRKITPAGEVTTLAGSGESGYADGPAGQARFDFIAGLAVDPNGTVYVSDNLRIRKITPDGRVSTLAGSGEYGQLDGPGPKASFRGLYGLALDRKGDLFAADGGSIRRIKPDGTVSTFVADKDSKGQPVFSELRGMAIEPHYDNLIVCDFFANRIMAVTPTGKVFKLAGSVKDSIDGKSDKAAFSHPIDVVLGDRPSGDLINEVYVVQAERRELRKIRFRPRATAP